MSTHLWKNSRRSFKLATYEPRGFNDGYDLAIQSSGTFPLNKDFEAA